jgi:hypothetical protein
MYRAGRRSRFCGSQGAILFLLASLILAALSGQPAGQERGDRGEREAGGAPGRAADRRHDQEADREPEREAGGWQERIERLRALPYVGLAADTAGGEGSGVVLWDRERTQPGYHLYCTRHTGEAFLMDLSGRIVHRWEYFSSEESGSYHHAVMQRDGDLLAIKQHAKLICVDWESRPLWERRCAVHHDLAPAPDGTLYAIVRDHRIYRQMRVWFDAIVHLTADGRELKRWSTFDHLDQLKAVLDTRSFLDTVLDSALAEQSLTGRNVTDIKTDVAKGRYGFDYFHINTISLLPDTPLGRQDPRFGEGNLLICLRNVNQIAILEKGSYRVLWAWGEGRLQWPHHPTLLKNGRILVFDNGVGRHYSRVVELDPVSGEIVWTYRAPQPEDFYSPARGSAQRLANGNTLICESDRGRAFEVTPAGEMVWLWLNPDRQGEHRRTVYRMMRLPHELIDPLLHRRWWYLEEKN